MRTPIMSCLALMSFTAACGVASGEAATPPTQAEIAEAQDKLEQGAGAAKRAKVALEILGLLPVSTCGESRNSFLGSALSIQDPVAIGCVTVSTRAELTSDVVELDFGATGCKVAGNTVSGAAMFRYSGGDDRAEVELDLRGVLVNGESVPVKAGYGTCGDEKRVWVAFEATVAPNVIVTLDGRVGIQKGLPIIGTTTLILNGTGEVRQTIGTDRLTSTELTYDVGDFAPKTGTLLVETSSGHRIEAKFDEKVWKLGEAQVTIDNRQPVTLVVVR